MKNFQFKYIIFICISCITLLIAGCSQSSQPEIISRQGVYFDTVISITLYDSSASAQKYLDGCFDIADNCENLFSKSIETSDVSRINNSDGKPVSVSQDTIDILKYSMKYSDASKGKFSVVCGSLTSLWNISEENPYIPTDVEIEEALKHVGNDKIEINEENATVTLLDPQSSIDLGAVAKGYIADKMKEYLLENGIESGIISLGGNILVIGEKPSGNISSKTNTSDSVHSEVKTSSKGTSSSYTIGIQKPFSNSPQDTIAALKVTDTSVVTSGNYQRYFKKDDKLYHHIIDLTTGYPADTGLNSVSIICPSSVDADMLSTICFLLGEKDGVELIESLNNTDAIFVSDTNKILYNSLEQGL